MKTMKKKLYLILIALMFGFMSAGNGLASSIYPDMDVAEFTFQGSDYSAASNTATHSWQTWGGSVMSPWAGMWVEYTAELFTGSWNIGINASNFMDIGTGWYDSFIVEAKLFNSDNAIVANETLSIAASSTEINHDFFNIFISDPDAYTVRYTWLNDKYDAALGLDANIIINSAFFHDPPFEIGGDLPTSPVPEPATMLLLGTGLVGVAGAARRKKKNQA